MPDDAITGSSPPPAISGGLRVGATRTAPPASQAVTIGGTRFHHRGWPPFVARPPASKSADGRNSAEHPDATPSNGSERRRADAASRNDPVTLEKSHDLTAADIIAEASLGAIVRWSDGSPRPPARHVRKVRDWEQRNGQGRLVECLAGSGQPMLDSFTIHEGDFGADGVVVLRVRRVFGANSACHFEIVSVPQPGEALVITSFAGRDELQHVAVSREAATCWQANHGYRDARIDIVPTFVALAA